jgi:plastocyanin
MQRRFIPLLGAAVLAFGLTGLMQRPHAVPVVRAADTWEVQAGGDVASQSIEPTAFFPSQLTIHVGDSVSWTIAGFHTVTFLSNQPPPAFITPGPGPGELTLGPAFFPIGPIGEDNSVSYGGAAQISSGTPLEGPDAPPFRVTFTAPGMFDYLCMVHPGMVGTVTVLAAGTALPETPAQAKARGQAAHAAVVAQTVEAAQSVQSTRAPAAGGATIHTLAVGLTNPAGASADRFLPGDITVRRGDIVVWTMADPANIHTVTFLSGAPTPAEVEVRPQPAGPPQIVFPANVAGPVGGPSYTGQGYVNSGLMSAGSSFVLTFDAPAGTYEYRCLIHSGAVAEQLGGPPMISHITVTD